MTAPAAVNGTPLSPQFVALLRQEEVRPDPPDSAVAVAEDAPPRPRRDLSLPRLGWHPDGDKVIRLLTASVVLAVAGFAAVVSYSHIYDLARRHRQDGAAARLLPLSIDGLIAAASLVMLHASRNGLPVPRLARAMLATGVVATVAANILFAIPPQWITPVVGALIGAAISAFPAVAFIGAVEMMIRFVRDAREAATAAAAKQQDSDTTDDSDGDKESDTGPPPDEKDRPPKAPRGRAKAIAIMKRNPKLPDAEVAKRAGVSERTVQRARQGLAATSK